MFNLAKNKRFKSERAMFHKLDADPEGRKNKDGMALKAVMMRESMDASSAFDKLKDIVDYWKYIDIFQKDYKKELLAFVEDKQNPPRRFEEDFRADPAKFTPPPPQAPGGGLASTNKRLVIGRIRTSILPDGTVLISKKENA
jgi:hypothetical protein